MRIREAIEMIDRLMPNQYGEEEKVHWLGELDGIADREVFRAHEREEDMGEFTGYPPGVDLDTILMIPFPYEDIYRWNLEMKICDANGKRTEVPRPVYECLMEAQQQEQEALEANRAREPKKQQDALSGMTRGSVCSNQIFIGDGE